MVSFFHRFADPTPRRRALRWLLAALAVMASSIVLAAPSPAPADLAGLVGANAKTPEFTSAMRIMVLLTVLSVLPALLIASTAFLRIIVVLSMLRHAIGMQDTPPNAALIAIALFLTLFTMLPVWNAVDLNAWQPYQKRQLSAEAAVKAGLQPVREFMVRQTRETDLALMVEISHAPQPETIDDIGTLQLIPAFMLSELRTAFQIGFMIFLPFLLVDLLVASMLTSLGMMMVPPVMISLPLKVLMFILIDGWNIVTRALLSSFH